MQPSTNIFSLYDCLPSNLSQFPTSQPFLIDSEYSNPFSTRSYEVTIHPTRSSGVNKNWGSDFQNGVNTPQFVSLSSNNSTSDEVEENQRRIINERKQRRKISNRESARRSRIRKQRQLDKLLSQVMWLRNENHQLLHKLNCVFESREKVIEENVQLKEETSELKKIICDIKLQNQSPFSCLGDNIV